jgi:chromosome segregation ATPase
MSEFQTTANETAIKLTMLVEEIDRSQTSLDNLDRLVSSTATQVNTQWTELTSRADTLIGQIDAIREQINTEVTEVEQALSQLQEKITSARSQVEQEFNETKASLNELDSALETVTSAQKEAWETTETAFTALQDKTQEIENTLETNLSETGTLIQDEFVTAMQTHESDIVQQTEILQTYISSEFLSQIADKSSEFSDRLSQFTEQLSQKLIEISSNSENSVSSFLEQAHSEHNSKIGDLVSTAGEVSHALEDVGKTVDKTSSNVTRMLSLLETATDTTNKGFNTTVDVFMEAKKLLARFD